MIKRLALLILLSVAPVFSQVGGTTALPPNPTELAPNQISSADWNFSAGTFAGYQNVDACASVSTANPYPGDTYSADLTKCPGGNHVVFKFMGALHNHEALLIRWQGYASPGYVGNGLNAGALDNNHGDGVTLYTTSQNQQVLNAPSSAYSQQFVVYWPNIVEHGSDNQTLFSFSLESPAWAASKAEVLGYEIVDSNGNIEQITTAGTTGTGEGTATLSAASAASGGDTTYTGSFTTSQFPVGATAYISGFTNAGNNGAFPIVSVTSTALVVTNSGGVAESHAASASTWNTTMGGTTTDNTATWTNEGPNPPFYITHIEVEDTWYPLRTMLLYPNYRGYLWSDLTPPKRFTQIQPVSAGSPFYNFLGTGSTPVTGEIMGVTTVDPPAANTLSQLTLTETMATVAGCGSGVLATDTFASPQSVQPWQFTPAQYGTLTVGSAYYVCSSLEVTSGSVFIASYPDWKIYYENAAFRNALVNWYDPNNTWYHNGNSEILLGTYDRGGSHRGTGNPTTFAGWQLGLAGLSQSCLPQAVNSPSPSYGNWPCDYAQQGFTGVMGSFNTFSAIDPIGGDTSSLGYWLELENTAAPFGIAHFQILNNWAGCAVTELDTTPPCTTPPTFAPTPTVGAGSITASYLFLEGVENGAPISQGNSPTRIPENTLPSTPVTVNLGAATCAGTNCGVTIPMPTCTIGRNLGWDLYAATGSTSTPPANSTFQRQYVPPVDGMLGSTDIIPCGATVTLNTVNSGNAPPTADNTQCLNGSNPCDPSWQTTQTDPQLWNLLYATMNNTAYKNAVGGIYMGDEPSFYSMPWIWEMKQNMFGSNYLNLPITGVIIQPTLTLMWCREIFDVCGEDPYGYNAPESPDEWVTGETSTQSCQMYGLGNVISTQPKCYRSRTDVYVDDAERVTFGARPSWNVVQQFGDTNPYGGYPYLEMKTQLWKCIIDEQVYGSLGVGCLTWGWVDSSGMEQTVMCYSGEACSPAAWYDSKRATNEIKQLQSIILTPVEDSPELGLGTVVSAASSSVTAATACSVQSGQTSMYTNTSLWPDAPAWFVTHTDPATGDEYIFANNLCSAASPFNETFTLANIPAGQTKVEVLNEGRTIALSGNTFSDSWQQTDAHIYVIRTPRGARIH